MIFGGHLRLWKPFYVDLVIDFKGGLEDGIRFGRDGSGGGRSRVLVHNGLLG
jgi:hypothetical protein